MNSPATEHHHPSADTQLYLFAEGWPGWVDLGGLVIPWDRLLAPRVEPWIGHRSQYEA